MAETEEKEAPPAEAIAVEGVDAPTSLADGED